MEEKISKCNKCGFCQEVCPTYMITKSEANVARGRIRLAHLVCEGNYKWGSEPEIEQHIKSCLLCKACVTNCPSSVATDKIIMAARERINAANGFSFFHKAAYRGVFAEQKRFKKVSSLARFYQHSGARRLVRGSRILGIAKKIKRMEDLLPPLPKKSFFQQAPGLVKNTDNPRFKIGYYVGCATNAFFSQVAVAAVKVLQYYNCKIYAPEVECCGGPHQSAGDFDEGKRLAKDTIDKFAGKELDYIVIDCATCGSTLKEYAELLKDDVNYSQKAQEVSDKIIDVNKFVLEYLEVDSTRLKNLNYRVSYHDPCHGVRGLKVSREPRELIKLVPGIEFIEMKQASLCCGGAGSYCFLQDDNSETILQLKMERFRETGANILAASCPACMMQLGHGLRSRNIKADTLHPIELLAKALNEFKG